MKSLYVLLFVLLVGCVHRLLADDFDKLFYFTWTTGEPERWGDNQDIVALKLTKRSGSGFASRNSFFHGRYSAKIKVPSDFTAGVITAFYLMSAWDQKWTDEGIDRHDEIDFEFLGNTTSSGVVVQTNWYSKGLGDHEQRHHLWFDPATEFHEYSIIFNWEHIVWLVDGIPIREEKKDNSAGTYPSLPMFLMGSIWEASSWATQGGKVKIDWAKEPFYAAFKDLQMQGCYWRNLDTPEPPYCALEDFIATWDAGFVGKEPELLAHAVKHYTYYDWALDTWRITHGMGLANRTSDDLKKKSSDKRDKQRKLLSLRGGQLESQEKQDYRLMRPWVKGIPGWPENDNTVY